MSNRPYGACLILGVLSFLGFASAARGAEPEAPGSIAGTVVSNTGKPAPDTVLTLVELRRQVRADDSGAYRFDDVPPGRYVIEAVSPRYGSSLVEARVAAGAQIDLPIELEVEVHAEHLTVTASPGSRGLSDVAQAVDVLAGSELESRLEPTLGETLSKQAGVSSTYFGPGASRPVIRGLGGDRIRVLDEGIGLGDASNVSPDHAVASDPLAAERIEIVRGPATLLYGSNAIGGVVNVIGGAIPDHRPSKPISGTLTLSGGSVADERYGSAGVSGGTDHVGFSAHYLDRNTDDYDIPDGTLTNTSLESNEGGVGASWLGQRGFLGVSFDDFSTLYGVPGDEPIQIDMDQQRYGLQGELNPAHGPFHRASVRAGATDYEHVELEETGEQGTRFTNDYWEGRIEGSHRPLGPLAGTVGLQFSSRDFEAIGEEAIVPPTTTDQAALFLFEELGPEKLRVSFGARYETNDVSVEGPADDRSFDTLSGAVGLVWKLGGNWAVTGSAASTRRPPVAEELYVDGAHPATQQFEIGDPTLNEESVLSYDLGLRRAEGLVSGEIGVFQYDFGDYIFLRPIGAVDLESGFDVFAFEQGDARFRGAEAHIDIQLIHADPHHLQLELGGDVVDAELTATGDSLPQIPPARVWLGLGYHGERLWANLEGRHSFEQNDVSAFETPTDSYTMLNAAVGYRLFGHGLMHELMLRGTNLTDELARNHVSPLKDVAPLPGADVNLMYRLTF